MWAATLGGHGLAVAQAPARAAFVMLQVEGLTSHMAASAWLKRATSRRCGGARLRGGAREGHAGTRSASWNSTVRQPLVLEGGLPVGIQRGLAGFSAFAPPGVLTRPERPQGAVHGLAGADFAQLIAAAIAALFADCLERTLRLVPCLARDLAVGGQTAASAVRDLDCMVVPPVGGADLADEQAIGDNVALFPSTTIPRRSLRPPQVSAGGWSSRALDIASECGWGGEGARELGRVCTAALLLAATCVCRLRGLRPIVGKLASQRCSSARSISVARPSLRAVSSFSRMAFLMRV